MSTEALQQTLAAEHAAVWLLALLGGQAEGDDALQKLVTETYVVHRRRRDDLIDVLVTDGEEPVAAEVGYATPELGDAARIMTAARGIEERCSETYAALVARTEGARRQWAIAALTDAAVRLLRFRGSPETFPGARDLADR